MRVNAFGNRVAEKIPGAMREEFVLDDRRLAVSTSVGVSFYKSRLARVRPAQQAERVRFLRRSGLRAHSLADVACRDRAIRADPVGSGVRHLAEYRAAD